MGCHFDASFNFVIAWYTEVSSFQETLDTLSVSGGGDGPESAVDALDCARRMRYREGVEKYIILMTDANYNEGISTDTSITLVEEAEKLKDENFNVSVVTKQKYYNRYSDLANCMDGIIADITQSFVTALVPLIDQMGEEVNTGCWVRLAHGSIVRLDKNPALGKVSAYNPYAGELQNIDTWSIYSNPAKADSDGVSDFADLQPMKYDTVVVEENDTYIKFNTGRVWYNVSCTSYDYYDNWCWRMREDI